MYIRQATPGDALLISQIIAASWRDAYQGLVDPVYLSRLPEEYWLPSMRSWLVSGRMYGSIAIEDEIPIGCIIYGRGRDDDHADWGEIVSLYVLPDRMRSGTGSALLTSALSELRADGYDEIYLWAIDGNKAADAFYLKHGFIHTDDQIQYKIGQWTMTDIRYILTSSAP